MAGTDDVVLGVDIGTTATKVIAYDVTGAARASASTDYPLRQPEPGAAVQDPHEVLAAVRGSVRAVARQLDGVRVAGLSFSAAMHSLLGLDAGGGPLTPLLTWADTRAGGQADRLRDEGRALELQQRTGTPVHPMSPLVKLMWLRESDPELHSRAARWIGIKEFVLGRWCDSDVSDHSIASAAGMLALDTLDWDAEALDLAGVRAEQLPRPVPTTTVLRTLSRTAAADLGLPEGTPLVVGRERRPPGQPGRGRRPSRPGGMLHRHQRRPACHGREARCGSCRGRLLLRVPAEALGGRRRGQQRRGGPGLGPRRARARTRRRRPELLCELAATAPAGAGGLLMLPYLLGERAPRWSSLPRGAYLGLTRAHRREHLVRAALEGVCLQLSLVLDSLRAAGIDVREVRATGGFARSPFWRQLLADVLGMPVDFPAGHEGSSFGAALLGMEALDLVGSIDLASDLVQVESTLTPDGDNKRLYADIRPVFGRLFDVLTPAFEDLRRLAPEFAADVEPGAHPEAAGGVQSTV